MKKTLILWVFAVVLALPASATQDTITLNPSEDTILHEVFPANNFGGGIDLSSGTTGKGLKTRSVLKFDLASKIPAGARIKSVSLTLRVVKEPASGGVDSNFDLRRVLVAWGEGDKANQSNQTGEPASDGQATWVSSQHGSTTWNGGIVGTHFAEAVSASTKVATRGEYTFAPTPELVADAQLWLADPAKNFGWVLLSQAESTPETARRFGAREDATAAPRLVVEFTAGPPPLKISSISLTSSNGIVSWTGGTPPFQLQRRAEVGAGSWSNVGSPGSERAVAIPLDGIAAFFRVAESSAILPAETANYEVVFQSTWTSTSHPQGFPSNPHWSLLIGGTHNAQAVFWEPGGMASLGIEDVAELGSIVALRREIEAAIAVKTAFNTFRGVKTSVEPAGSDIFAFTVHRDFPLVTLVTMIAPSPDWFTGVHGLSLIEDSDWAPSKSVILDLYDAGTDSGPTYQSPNSDTQPRERIRRITGFPAFVGGQLVPFAKMTFTRK